MRNAVAQLNQLLLASQWQNVTLLEYLGRGGGRGLNCAFGQPESIIKTIEEAGLRGMGGGGFPVHLKWRAMRAHKTDGVRYLLVNGNEDEPGTFKDSLLLEKSPHQVVEGALIAAIACQVNRIVFYVNPARKAAVSSIKQAAAEWEGTEIYQKLAAQPGQDLTFLFVESSGHYIAGEETAAIEVVEGKFPFPRGRPPWPVESGIDGFPTLINNVETLCHVTHILASGADRYREYSLTGNGGTKLFCLSGDVKQPGVYELPLGISLRELIYEYGQGMLNDTRFRAVFTGGPSSGVLGVEGLDIPLDFETLLEADASLGTGAMIVVGSQTSMISKTADYAEFFARASCGQCVSCKLGTGYASKLLQQFTLAQANQGMLDQLKQLIAMLPGSGKCSLPDGAVKVIQSSLKHFPEDYSEAITVATSNRQ